MQAQSHPHAQTHHLVSPNPSESLNDEKAEVKDSQDISSEGNKDDSKSENVDKDNADGQTEPENPSQEQEGQQPQEPPFSILSPSEKRFVVVIASLAALFSPLSANIYFPALNTLSEDLHESVDKINLTITTYLVRHRVPL